MVLSHWSDEHPVYLPKLERFLLRGDKKKKRNDSFVKLMSLRKKEKVSKPIKEVQVEFRDKQLSTQSHLIRPEGMEKLPETSTTCRGPVRVRGRDRPLGFRDTGSRVRLARGQTAPMNADTKDGLSPSMKQEVKTLHRVCKLILSSPAATRHCVLLCGHCKDQIKSE